MKLVCIGSASNSEKVSASLLCRSFHRLKLTPPPPAHSRSALAIAGSYGETFYTLDSERILASESRWRQDEADERRETFTRRVFVFCSEKKTLKRKMESGVELETQIIHNHPGLFELGLFEGLSNILEGEGREKPSNGC